MRTGMHWHGLAPFVLSLGVLAGCAGTPPAPQGEAAGADQTAQPREQAAATPAAPGQNGLGLTRDELVEAAAAQGLITRDAFELQDLGDGREVLIASVPQASSDQVVWIAIFGEPQQAHTVRVDFFPVNAEPADSRAVEETIDGVVAAIFPNWPEASEWAEAAGNRAWQETAQMIESDPTRRDLPVFETTRDDLWLAALGVPPGVISYVITANANCRPQASDSFYQGYSACR